MNKSLDLWWLVYIYHGAYIDKGEMPKLYNALLSCLRFILVNNCCLKHKFQE